MHDASARRRIRFGAFELDVRSEELRKGPTRLKVPAQSIQILIALLEEPGELVTRDELRRRLWSSETFVDFEQGLNTAVRRLREALGDSADAPRFIETLPRRGYRFIGAAESQATVPSVPDYATANVELGAATLRVGEQPAAAPARARTRFAFAMWILAAAILVTGVARLATAVRQWRQQAKLLEWARGVAPGEVSRLIDRQDYDGAFRLARRAFKVDPENAQLKQVWTDASRPTSITSEPSGADVFVRGYRAIDADWLPLGRTPLDDVRIPGGLLRFRLAGDGMETFEGASQWGRRLHFTLRRSGTSPPGMVWVPNGVARSIGGSAVAVTGFWMDRLEVTNREFKAFVDAGGYASPEYWTEPFVSNGRRLPWTEGIQQFTDTTGRAGPASWEVGTYPDGQDDYPVTGVSWYEAVAYLAFAGKSLPTVHHWRRASGVDLSFADIIPLSNFGRRGPARAGSHPGLGMFGTLDMAGNAKEWCWNAADGRRLIMGGAWSDEPYLFGTFEAFQPMERHVGFGFRGIRETGQGDKALREPISIPRRDPPRPVSDELYRVYAGLFAYDRAPVAARVDAVDEDNPHWVRQTVSFVGPDGIERIPAVLFLPRNARPPYQLVIYFPGADAELLRSRSDMSLNWIGVVVRSGRAVLHPIYRGTFERGISPNEMGPHTWRDTRIVAGKEIGRALDFVEARPDLDKSRIAFMGVSNGAAQGVIASAVEPRLRTSILLGAGLPMDNRTPPELDPANYAPQVRLPTLLINGQWDFILPYETTQLPLFRLLGTAPEHKRLETFPGGHVPLRRHEIVAVVLRWLDAYLGPVVPASNPADMVPAH